MRVITPSVLLLWVAYAWLTVDCLRHSRGMPFLGVYLAFSTLRTAILMGVALGGSPIAYWGVYWPLQGIGYVLSGLLALSLILSVVSDLRRRLDLEALIIFLIVLPFIMCFWEGSWHPWLTACKWADAFVVWLLICALSGCGPARKVIWGKAKERIALGLVIGMAGHMACALLQGDRNPPEWLRVLYQLASLAQFTIWSATLRMKPEEQPNRIVPLQYGSRA